MLDVEMARQYAALFKEILPIPPQEIESWRPYGENSILIKLTTGYEMIFMVYQNKAWRIFPHSRLENY